MAASAKKCLFWEIVRSVFRTRSRVHPSFPKVALRQESQKDSLDEQSCDYLTCSHPDQWSVRRDSCWEDLSVQRGAACEECLQQRQSNGAPDREEAAIQTPWPSGPKAGSL